MTPQQQEHCQKKVADLEEEIEKLERRLERSLTDGAREYWRSEIWKLSKRRDDFRMMLLEERPPMRLEPWRR